MSAGYIAPYYARTIGSKTPCATTMRCTDCNTHERICGIKTIIEKRPRYTKVGVIVVGEDLGLGWNPDWPEERIENIARIYKQTMTGVFTSTNK